ncbi:MAG: gliding motility lipoprotein GldH [Imperialibacter sp.]
MRTPLLGSNLGGLICLSAGLIFLLSSCSDSRIYDEYHDFTENVWHMDSTEKFTFTVDTTADQFRLSYLVRNTADYSYYNLYLKFTLEDSLHQVIESQMQEVILFDPKTGKPYGSGLGDLFSHEFPAIDNFTFPYKGKFTFSVQQYMRVESLAGIQSLGLKVERVKQE